MTIFLRFKYFRYRSSGIVYLCHLLCYEVIECQDQFAVSYQGQLKATFILYNTSLY